MSLALEAVPTGVFLAHSGSTVALLAIRPSAGESALYLPLEPGSCAFLGVAEGLETAGIVFDYVTSEGAAVCGARLFAEGGLTRRSLVLREAESSQYALVAKEFESSGGSSWNITIGPPPRDSRTERKGEVLLFPNGAYSPEPGFQPVGGYHSPL